MTTQQEDKAGLRAAVVEMGQQEMLEFAVQLQLMALGYDDTDQHFVRTPQRVAKVLQEFALGKDETPKDILEAVFDDEHDSMVVVGPTQIVSFCAHHMLPVRGQAWVGYIPDGRVVGISKLARIVHFFGKRFTVQERVTQQVVEALMLYLAPLGAMCVIQAEHGCMSIRGVREPTAVTSTSAVRGVFKDDPAAREEFLRLTGR